MSECFDNLGDIKIQNIGSLNSQSSARDIINRNFKALRDAVICISEISIEDIGGLILPDPPQNNVQYVLQWNGSAFEFVVANTNPGTKYIIQADEYIKVLEDYQYIVHDTLFLYGTLDVEGELVIL